ncbi:MAG: hypothetical protein V1835_02920 [Candidatus Micrarchaeota archaeon]
MEEPLLVLYGKQKLPSRRELMAMDSHEILQLMHDLTRPVLEGKEKPLPKEKKRMGRPSSFRDAGIPPEIFRSDSYRELLPLAKTLARSHIPLTDFPEREAAARLAVARAIHGYASAGGKLGAIAYSAITNALRDLGRRSGKNKRAPFPLHLAAVEEKKNLLDPFKLIGATKQRLNKSSKSDSKSMLAILLSCFYPQLTGKEVSGILDMNHNTLRTILRHYGPFIRANVPK